LCSPDSMIREKQSDPAERPDQIKTLHDAIADKKARRVSTDTEQSTSFPSTPGERDLQKKRSSRDASTELPPLEDLTAEKPKPAQAAKAKAEPEHKEEEKEEKEEKQS
jgi:hypothetical protein